MTVRSALFKTITTILACGLLLVSCGESGKHSNGDFPRQLRLAEQYGLAYAPVAAARLNGWFEDELPGVEMKWSTMGNAASIREAMLAGRLDGGCMGIPPYLIGLDRGMDWIALSAVSEAALGLAAADASLAGLTDLPGDARIALPQPGSIQHILLGMASKRAFGAADYFDENLVTLSHPDGMSALVSGADIDAHFTSPPFLQKELEGGAVLVLEGRDAFGGDFTFIISVISGELAGDYPKAVEGIEQAIDKGRRWIEENPGKAANLLAGHFGMDSAELEGYFRSGSVSFTGPISGMQEFALFLDENGYLKNGLPDETQLIRR